MSGNPLFEQIINDPQSVFRVNNLLYKVDRRVPTIGDLVIDTHSFTYGVVKSVSDDGYYSVRDCDVTEIGIPMSRLRPLILTVDHKQLN